MKYIVTQTQSIQSPIGQSQKAVIVIGDGNGYDSEAEARAIIVQAKANPRDFGATNYDRFMIIPVIEGE